MTSLPLEIPLEIILASASPRRQELLARLGLSFKIQAADIDESLLANESPIAMVMRLSEAKARAICKSLASLQTQEQPIMKRLILAADTTVVVDNTILAKPQDEAENFEFIKRLSGRKHEVYTGYSLIFNDGANWLIRNSYLSNEVWFRELAEAEILWYVATQEGLDKAGGYAIQGFGSSLVKAITGCYFNVMGLSLAHLCEEAKELGVRLVGSA
ncbi:MAG: Maf family protein [Deinococcales bacterium]